MVFSLLLLSRIIRTLLRVAPDMLFGTADTLAEHLGITGSDTRRLGGFGMDCTVWIIKGTCLPVDQLIGRLDDLLQTDVDDIANFIEKSLRARCFIVRIMKIFYIYPQKCMCLK